MDLRRPFEGKETPVEAAYNAKELTAKNPQARIVFGQPFSGPGGKRGSKAYDMLMSFTAIGAGRRQRAGKLETILQILDYVSANPDPEEDASLKYGVKGKHWVWAEAAKEDVIVLPSYDRMSRPYFKYLPQRSVPARPIFGRRRRYC